MEKKKQNKKKFAKKLLHKYRLVVLNEDTFEEKLSFKLTRLNVFVVVTLSAIFLIAATIYIIAFTGLKEYIPGYSSAALKRQAIELEYTTDSIQNVMRINDQYYESVRKVLTGELDIAYLNRDSVMVLDQNAPNSVSINTTRADSLLREQVAQEDRFNIIETAGSNVEFALFPPVKGPISEGYDLRSRHYAVDIVVAKNTPVKSIADGRVIFSEWTVNTGYVIIIEHNYGLVSAYKHNSSLAKEQGDMVKTGEVIATAGSTGELSTGPHLHFELWNEGNPVNPVDYIDFE